MRTVGIREAKTSFCELIERAQGERVVVTKHGHPVALIIGMKGQKIDEVLALLRKKRK